MTEILDMTRPHTVRRIVWEPNTDRDSNQTLRAVLSETQYQRLCATLTNSWGGYGYLFWIERKMHPDLHVVLGNGFFAGEPSLAQMQKQIAQEFHRALTNLRQGLHDLCSGPESLPKREDQPGDRP